MCSFAKIPAMIDLKQYIAVDLGAQSGRVILGSIYDSKLELAEIHRFVNGPVEESDSLRWDFNKLFSNIKDGIAKAVKVADGQVCGIGVDSWGVDFGLIDEKGELVENPYHYRDSRTDDMMEKAFSFMSKREIYNHTGIQFAQYNSLYQLLALQLAKSRVLTQANKLLFIADLIAYNLCGRIFSEYTIASTSQLMDMKSGRWSQGIFQKLELPINIMPEIVSPGTILGHLKSDVAEELGCPQIPVVAVASHDTACAVAAVPCDCQDWAYISSGTWSLMGIETKEPIINNQTFERDFTNEGGVDNTLRVLKNIVGLWLVEECRRYWKEQGADLSYQDISEMVRNASPWAGFLDVDCSDFFAPGDMPEKINSYLKKTGQRPVKNKGEMIRLILESMAFKYRWVFDNLEAIRGRRIDVIHIVGGGIKNEILCQFTANATGRKVITGPVEATATGNILMQAIAAKQIKSLKEARQIILNSNQPKEYKPYNEKTWDDRYQNYWCSLLSTPD